MLAQNLLQIIQIPPDQYNIVQECQQPNNVVIPQYLMTNTYGQFHFFFTEKTVTELNVDSGVLH